MTPALSRFGIAVTVTVVFLPALTRRDACCEEHRRSEETRCLTTALDPALIAGTVMVETDTVVVEEVGGDLEFTVGMILATVFTKNG